jgi:hypothetical protein
MKNKNKEVEVSAEPIAEVSAEPTAVTSVTVTLNTKARKDAWIVYDLPGGGLMYLPSAKMASIPSVLTVSGLELSSKPKETADERKARLAAESPADKAKRAREAADKAAKKAAELEAEAAAATV